MNRLHLTVLGLVAASGVGLGALRPTSPPSDREAVQRVYRKVLERAYDREHVKTLQVDLFRDHSNWNERVTIHSKHYAVETTNPAHGRNIGAALDHQLSELQKLLGTSFAPSRPFPVWIVPKIEQYTALGESSDEHSSFYGSFYAESESGRPVVSIYDLQWNHFNILHSAVHQFVDAAFPRARLKPWLREGLAHYLVLNSSRSNRDWAAGQHRANESRYTPLRYLFQEEDLSKYGDANEAHRRLLQLGLLFRFLLEECPDTAATDVEPEASFGNHLRSLLQGNASHDGFARLFLTNRGQNDLDAMFRDCPFE